jgi:hypothetical protein
MLCRLMTEVLSVPHLAKLIAVADEHKGGPFDGWSKIQALISKSRTSTGLYWTFCAVPASLHCQLIALSHFSYGVSCLTHATI